MPLTTSASTILKSTIVRVFQGYLECCLQGRLSELLLAVSYLIFLFNGCFRAPRAGPRRRRGRESMDSCWCARCLWVQRCSQGGNGRGCGESGGGGGRGGGGETAQINLFHSLKTKARCGPKLVCAYLDYLKTLVSALLDFRNPFSKFSGHVEGCRGTYSRGDHGFEPVPTGRNAGSKSRVRPGVSPRWYLLKSLDLLLAAVEFPGSTWRFAPLVLAQIRGLTTCFRWRTNFGAFVTVFRGRVADTSTQGLS